MIVYFKAKKMNKAKAKPRNLKQEARDLNEESKDLDYSSIAAKLCGQELTDQQKKDVEEFNEQYDKMQDLDSWH